MKKTLFVKLVILIICLFVFSSNTVVKAESKFAGQTLTIYNVEDYISTGSDGSVDLIQMFEDKYDVKVNYYTYDTNETMYNQFTLQKEGTYDLVCTSEYMIQKMVKEGLIDPMDDFATYVPNYEKYGSKVLREKLKNMELTYEGKTVNLDDFVVGYMWGTLGILYDPNCSDTIREDVKSWDIFWDSKYENLISIKNSLRDAFVPGLFHHYSKDADYQALKEAYLANPNEENKANYNKKVQDIFDFKLDGSEASEKENYEKIANVKEELISMKDNIFGFEVDNGKNDMVTGKIKLNLAYSGDAVYSIDTAAEEADKDLEFYVPEDGSNIWYDGWFLPKGANKELAYLFLDFMSDPEIASENMDYIGYTTYVTGDAIFTLAGSWYGACDFDINSNYEEDTLVIYDNILYNVIKGFDTGEGILPTNDEYFESLEYDASTVYHEGDMISYNGKIYNALEDVSEINPTMTSKFEEVEGYDISYLFGDVLSEGRRPIIYASLGSQNELETQYPSQTTIARCAVMNDFGVYNDAVVIMWGQVKAYRNMTPIYIFLIVFIALGLTFLIVYESRKKISLRNKKRISNI